MIPTCSRTTLGVLTRTYLRTSGPSTSAVCAWTSCECHQPARHRMRYSRAASFRDHPPADTHVASIVLRLHAFVSESMGRKLISDHLAALHHESDAFQLANLSNGVTGNSDKIGKFPRLNRADTVAPT